jgi:AcrR family transcriptional regulator
MALYRHYADKDALLDALVADGFAQFEVVVQKAADEATPLARLRSLCEGYVEFALSRPRLFELMFLIPRPGVPPAPTSLQSSPSAPFTRIIASVHEAMQAGTIAADDPAQVMLLLWSTIHGLVALHFSGRFQFDDAAFRQLASAQIDRGVRWLAACPSSRSK